MPDGRVPGPVLFARYAFGPNRLGYCGPDDARGLFDAAVAGDDGDLRQMAQGFEGAYPYLDLIARANGIADPLDAGVVEAYWLGNELLRRVPAAALHDSLGERFRPRLRPEGWRWLATKAPAEAHPVHAFHVFDVFPRLGLMRSGALDGALGVMDACRIRWGEVRSVEGERLLVDVAPLTLVEGKLRLGERRPELVQRWLDGTGFVDGVAAGDVVSIHWGWACDRLDARRLRNLAAWTARQLRLANRTV